MCYRSVSHVENSSGESPSAPPRQKWKKEDIYESLPSSLKSELIVRSRNIVDDDELKQRQELIRSHTPSQLSEIHSLKDFPVPKFIEQHLHKSNDDKMVEEEGAAKEPFSIYESLVPASLKTNLVVKTVMEEPHIQAERAEAVKAKSVNELSQIHSLSDLPVPSTLLNLAKKGYAPVQRKKKFKEQMSELKSQSTQSLAQSIQSTLHATLPRSLSEKQLLVRSRVEQPDVLAERRRLVESKAVSELSQLSSFHDLPVPTPLSKFFHKSMEKLDSLATSFKSFSTNDLAVRSAAAAEEEEGGSRARVRLSWPKCTASMTFLVPPALRTGSINWTASRVLEEAKGEPGPKGTYLLGTGTCRRRCTARCPPRCPSPVWCGPRWRTRTCCWRGSSCSRQRASMSCPRYAI